MTPLLRGIFAGGALCASCLLNPVPGAAQNAPQPAAPAQTDRATQEAAERARQIAQAFEANARVLTLFDRSGKTVGTIGTRGIYQQPVLSPDRSRVAVIRADLQNETNDLWVLDAAGSREVQITKNKPREGTTAPAWSPDGRYVAYVALRGSRYNILRRASDGSGEEELLYAHPGGPIVLTDWSLDGRLLSFYASDLSGSTLYLLPVDGARQPIEAARSEKEVVAARLSPDARLLAYRSNETGRNEIWVRAVPPAGATNAPADTWQVSTEGGAGMVFWRRDGRELYYLAPDRSVMMVEVKTGGQSFEFSRPRPLFKLPDSLPMAGAPGGLANVSRDGERVVVAVPPPVPLRQLTVFDRSGRILSRVGQPGLYVQPSISPDGSKIAVIRTDPQTGTGDIWAFDIATGKSTAVTSDPLPENAPVWSPDGKQVAYVSMRNNFAGIYRKPWTGQGTEEQLFRYTSGAGMVLTDFSKDGRFVAADGGGLVMVVPLTGNDALKREAVDFARSEFEAGAGRFSPDGRYVAFGSNETGRFEVYVRPFDPATGEAIGETKWQISKEGAMGGLNWREDGKELFFLSADQASRQVRVMAVDVSTTPVFTVGTPRELFRVQGPLPGNPAQWKNVTPDGNRFIFAMPVQPTPGR